MKNLFILAALFATLAPLNANRPQGPREQRAEGKKDDPILQLGLTPTQWDQVKAIRKPYPKPMSEESKRECRQRILAILTPEQKEKLRSLPNAQGVREH